MLYTDFSEKVLGLQGEIIKKSKLIKKTDKVPLDWLSYMGILGCKKARTEEISEKS